MLTFNIITVLPQLFEAHFANLPFKRALSKKSISTRLVNLRDFALDSYGTIDDKPFGGGVGMILMIEPIYKALLSLYPDMESVSLESFIPTFRNKHSNHKIIVLDPKGKKYTQTYVEALSKTDTLTFICGRYEGIDQRVSDYLATDTISVGDYVLSGGELPALTIMESVTRILPGVLEKENAAKIESFSEGSLEVEFPQYTRPETYKGQSVPSILLSGDHKKISEWRNTETKPKSN